MEVPEMTLKPLFDRVIIKPTEQSDRTAGGLFIPQNVKEKPADGIIVAAGPGKKLEDGTTQPMSAKVGDRVMFSKFSGTDFKWYDDVYLIMREIDVYGIF